MKRLLAAVLLTRGWIAIRLGQLDEAQRVLQNSRHLFNDLGVDSAPYTFADDPNAALGILARVGGDLSEGQMHFEASHALRTAFNDPEGMALALAHPAETAALQGDAREAERRYR